MIVRVNIQDYVKENVQNFMSYLVMDDDDGQRHQSIEEKSKNINVMKSHVDIITS